jgi:hypothetical protein
MLDWGGGRTRRFPSSPPELAMSIDRVLATSATTAPEAHSAELRPRAGTTAHSNSIPPDSGPPPIRQTKVPPNQKESVELPRDEVQVQRDSQNQIVIKYLDGSGKVIFQVPSSQIVALQQAIEQALEDQAQRRWSATLRARSSPQGVRHGH